MLAIVMLGALAGCAETTLVAHNAKRLKALATGPDPVGRYKVGSPYQIKAFGTTGRYWLFRNWDRLRYGPNFGKKTANGEIFDQRGVGGASHFADAQRRPGHQPGERRAMVIRVNDRGPFAHGRIIDLSKRGATAWFQAASPRVRDLHGRRKRPFEAFGQGRSAIAPTRRHRGGANSRRPNPRPAWRSRRAV